jgi:iron complex transport system ATP-binding protein
VEFPVTVRELVMSGRAPHQGILGLEHDEDGIMVESAMAYTDISHLGHRALNSLSGGERQRVYIAAAICQDPSVILLDEPTSALDLNHQMRVMDLMERLKHDRQTTVVMILHDINLAAMVADKILILKHGNVFAQGPATDVLTREILEDVYECRLIVDRHPLALTPWISVVPEKYAHGLAFNRR